MTTAAELRRAFDGAFAEMPRAATADIEDFLIVRADEAAYAVRFKEILGLYANRGVTPLPGPVSTLLGVAAFRGSVVPVYDLCALLGRPRSDRCRWLVLAGRRESIGFAFDEFGGQVRVTKESIAVADSATLASPYIRETVRVAGIVYPAVDVASLIGTIGGYTTQKINHEER